MLKKLTDDKQRYILEIGISEFAEHGVDRASMAANFVLEFLYDRFFVFGKSLDTNALAKKNAEKETE